jgi:hypothetical protein
MDRPFVPRSPGKECRVGSAVPSITICNHSGFQWHAGCEGIAMTAPLSSHPLGFDTRVMRAGDETGGWHAIMDGPVDESASLKDWLSAINPLHHLPIVGSIYRELTGEVIKPTMRVLGGALFGGPIGLVTSVANAIIEQVSGRDVGGHVMAMLAPSTPDVAVVVAANEAPPATELNAIAPAAQAAATAAPMPLSPRSLAGGHALETYQRFAGARLPVLEPQSAIAAQSQAVSLGADKPDISRAMLDNLDRYRAAKRAAPGLDVTR